MRIGIAADHAGFQMKEALRSHIAERGHEVVDFGCDSAESCDYPLFAERLADAVAGGEVELGIFCCGTGLGPAMACNKVPGVRAAPCSLELAARYARSHNDANVLCLGARLVGLDLAMAIVKEFLETPFEGGRHARRVAQIADIERRRARG